MNKEKCADQGQTHKTIPKRCVENILWHRHPRRAFNVHGWEDWYVEQLHLFSQASAAGKDLQKPWAMLANFLGILRYIAPA